jgi:hypothetical protein
MRPSSRSKTAALPRRRAACDHQVDEREHEGRRHGQHVAPPPQEASSGSGELPGAGVSGIPTSAWRKDVRQNGSRTVARGKIAGSEERTAVAATKGGNSASADVHCHRHADPRGGARSRGRIAANETCAATAVSPASRSVLKRHRCVRQDGARRSAAPSGVLAVAVRSAARIGLERVTALRSNGSASAAAPRGIPGASEPAVAGGGAAPRTASDQGDGQDRDGNHGVRAGGHVAPLSISRACPKGPNPATMRGEP